MSQGEATIRSEQFARGVVTERESREGERLDKIRKGLAPDSGDVHKVFSSESIAVVKGIPEIDMSTAPDEKGSYLNETELKKIERLLEEFNYAGPVGEAEVAALSQRYELGHAEPLTLVELENQIWQRANDILGRAKQLPEGSVRLSLFEQDLDALRFYVAKRQGFMSAQRGGIGRKVVNFFKRLAS